MTDKSIDEVMEIVDCFGGMKQNAGIECANRDEADFYESIASDRREAIRAKLREVLERKPLTPNEVGGICESAGYWPGDMSKADFINGIRYAEMHHQIGAEQ